MNTGVGATSTGRLYFADLEFGCGSGIVAISIARFCFSRLELVAVNKVICAGQYRFASFELGAWIVEIAAERLCFSSVAVDT
jgi:hypothetical protein